MSPHYLPRAATRRFDQGFDQEEESRALADWSHLDAYVLLAEPGGGKSFAFEHEAKACHAEYIRARDFANLQPHEAWVGKTLFIDALDEMRADGVSRDGPLDAVIRRLDELGRPRFRLSCREADWLAAVDQPAVRAVAPGRQVDVLHLDPLSDEQILVLLKQRAHRVADPAGFVAKAQANGVDAMLRNPLLLALLVDAVGEEWPHSREEVFRLACEHMASEHNPALTASRRAAARPVEQTLRDAGLLCAVLLLSGLEAFVVGPGSAGSAECAWQFLPDTLDVRQLEAALSTKLFVADGQRRLPRHRSVAEYLAAVVLGERVDHHGLPIIRVLALMSGHDGGIVEPLRGLAAWLSVTCRVGRSMLIDRDPLACVLYGDVRSFDTDDKRRILEGLGREAEQFAWFRRGQWAAHPFGALATRDMTPTFAALLALEDRSIQHQAVLDCVLDAVQCGGPMPALLLPLEGVVRDPSYMDDLRGTALDAWLSQSGIGRDRMLVWLEEIRQGSLRDDRDELCGRLLSVLYPRTLGPDQVMRYFHLSKTQHYIGSYRLFWSVELIAHTAPSALPVLMDALAALEVPLEMLHSHFDMPRIFSEVMAAALEAHGAAVNIDRLITWLKRGVGEYDTVAINRDDAEGIRLWLERHPDLQKSVVERSYETETPDPETGRYLYQLGEELLYGARRPRDWYRWLLDLATRLDALPLVEHCFTRAAWQARQPSPDFDLDLEDVERWVDPQRHRWPESVQWLEHAWSSSLTDPRRKNHVREQERAVRLLTERAARRESFKDHLDAMATGRAASGVMDDLACAYHGAFSNIRGETPKARVREFLGVEESEAVRAIDGFVAALSRADLPSVEVILTAGAENCTPVLRRTCLLGATLAFERDPASPLRWDETLVRRLIAYQLSYGTEEDGWYCILAEHRPGVVAEVLIDHVSRCVTGSHQHPAGLYRLGREERFRDLAQATLPSLLEAFPERSRPAQLSVLNADLLPAAIRQLPPDIWAPVVNARLALLCTAPSQRLPWLVAGLRLAPHRRSREIAAVVGGSRARAMRVGAILDAQWRSPSSPPRLPVLALGRLIEVLAPHASPDFPAGVGWVGDRERLRNHVRGWIHALGSVDDEEATSELERLRKCPLLSAWKILLDAVLSDHVRAVRNARYAHADVHSVAKTLSKSSPANALDLAALLLQHLDQLQAELVGDDTNSLRSFWRDATPEQPLRPRIENECRDLLYAKLRDRLLLQDVALHKEPAHANDTRADLRAEVVIRGERKVVPVEIKKDGHAHLWTAWKEQLVQQYMTDPAAAGVGIYLVLWFGWQTTGLDGVMPASAAELEARLRALVPREDRIRLQIKVIDLSVGHRRAVRKKKRGSA